MLGKLTPYSGGPPVALLKPKLLVGRHSACDIVLGFSTVSGRHCELELQDGYWLVRDLKSSNGTRINGTVCTSEWLHPGDVLWVSVHRYTIWYEPPAGRPPPARMAPPPDVKIPTTRNPPMPEKPPEPKPTQAPSNAPPMGKLVPCGGGAPIPLQQPRLIVGRDNRCDIVLRFAFVSSRHCELAWKDGYWVVHDLGSRNGVRVDDKRCDSQRLLPGSNVWIGGLRFEILYAPQAALSSPESPSRVPP
jgi:adenylate cyclase